MRVTLRNKHLELTLGKYQVTDVRKLTQDQMQDICEDLSIPTVQLIDKQKGTVIGLDKLRTLDSIRYATSIPSQYIPSTYWEESQRELAAEYEVVREMQTHEKGNESFALMAELGLGWHNFRAGDVIELDLPWRWIEKEVLAAPYAKYLEIKDENGAVITSGYSPDRVASPISQTVEPIDPDALPTVSNVTTPPMPTLEKKDEVTVALENITREDLIELVHEKTGKKHVNKSKEELLKIYSETK